MMSGNTSHCRLLTQPFGCCCHKQKRPIPSSSSGLGLISAKQSEQTVIRRLNKWLRNSKYHNVPLFLKHNLEISVWNFSRKFGLARISGFHPTYFAVIFPITEVGYTCSPWSPLVKLLVSIAGRLLNIA